MTTFEYFRDAAKHVDGHWLWPVTNWAGYPKGTIGVRPNRKTVALHRWIYEQLIGPIPDGLEIDHKCRQRNCINPDHLEPVTSSENKRRAHAARGVYDQCPNGHPRSAPPPGGRVSCKTCKRDEARRRRERGVSADAIHGRSSTYGLGCRCETCSAARRAYDVTRRAAAYGIEVDG